MRPVDRAQSHRGGHRRSRLAFVAIGAVAVLASSDGVMAAWTSPAAGAASAAGATVPAGPQPAVTVVGRNVTITWPPTVLSSGDAPTGYRVRRFGPSGTATDGSSCQAVQTGLSCTEGVVAPGTWSYAVTALAGSWAGSEGQSAAAVVPAPAFTISAGSAVTGVLGTVAGTVSGFAGPAGLTFRLDNPSTGQVLTGTPTTVPADGRADVSVSVPASVTDGSHTIYAIGGGGDVVGAQVVIDATPPVPTSVTTGDGGGTAGSAEAGDWLEVTFSEPLRASSMCAAWADDGTTAALTAGVTVAIANNGSLTSTDLLTVHSLGCGGGGFRFGALDLGGKGYVRSGTTANFGAAGTSSTVTWSPATSTLRIVLGTAGTNRFGVVPSSVIVYTPDGAMTDLRGLGATGVAITAGRQL